MRTAFFHSYPRIMAHRRLIWQRCVLVLGIMLLGLGSKCDAAVREYALISVKIGTSSSTSSNTGTFVFELWPDLAPKTVQNFKHLANTRFYDGTASHRLIPGFMIQAGDPNTRSDANVKSFGQGGPGHTIPDELAKESDASWEKRRHVPGILSMAHSNNSDPTKGPLTSNTGGSQFFVMLGNASDLDGVHTTFGTLTSGSEFLEKLKQVPTLNSDTTAFDFNNNGVFDNNEKQTIIKTFNRDEPTWKTLAGKGEDQELTDDDRALIANAISSFSDLNNDGVFTESELNDPKNNAPRKTDQPTERIEIQSVRVFAVDDASSTSFPFKATTHSGLLRPADRSSVAGCYQISVLSTGVISGLIEYQSRRASFAVPSSLPVIGGSLISSNDIKMAVLTGTIDASSTSPILLDIVLQKAYSKDSNENAISIELSNKNRAPLAYGFSESPTKASKHALARQYTMLAQPSRVLSFIPSVGWQSDTTSIRGSSVFLIRVNPSLGLSYVSGRLSDGAPFTTSRIISSEHGANILPLYSYKLPSFLEDQRDIFSSLDLIRTSSTSLQTLSLEELTFLNTTSLGFGSVQLAEQNSTTAALGTLLWMHPSTTSSGAPLKNRYRVDTVTATTPWTPPMRNTVMKPFSSISPRGQLLLNETPFNFSLVKNTTAVFEQPISAAKPFLSFDPTTGAFSGIFNDTSKSPARRRNFSGVLLNSTNATGGFGYYLDSNSSKSVRLLPIVP